VLTGFQRADAGRIHFDGRDVTRWPPHRLARAGMVRTFQLTRALQRMTVLDNLKLAAQGQRGEGLLSALVPGRWRTQEAEIEARADDLLVRFGLAARRDDYAGTLSGGQRKLLELARALMVEPSLLLLDEPAAGVNRALCEDLLDHLEVVRDTGTTLLFVEHDMDVVARISDWVLCMAQGALIAEGTAEDIVANPAVIDAYLGTGGDVEDPT